MERIVVTGATSMIGMALVNEALAAKVQVLAIIRPNSKRKEKLSESNLLKIIECDCNLYDKVLTDEYYHTFFHLAWTNTEVQSRNNVEAQIKNVIYEESAVKLANRLHCSAFVGVGSQAEYGIRFEEKPITPQTPVNPESAYGIAKYASSRVSRLLCGTIGMRHCWARIFSVYGEYDRPQTLIMSCIHKFLNEEAPQLTLCEQKWDYIYSKDVGRALLAIGRNGKNDSVYCVGSGNWKPLKYYVDGIGKALQSEIRPIYGAIDYFQNQPMYLCADITTLKEDTGFEPLYSFSEGMEKTIKWVKEQCNE